MTSALPIERLLRYGRQIVLDAMGFVRTNMRGRQRLEMAATVPDPTTPKAAHDPTRAIDRATEGLMLDALEERLARIQGLGPVAVFSEEIGIKTFPESAPQEDARLVVFMDPIDGTEFAKSLQGGWSLLAFYDRERDETIAAIAGDIFLDRLYWASAAGGAEAIDFITHSWFRLDGGPSPAERLCDARVNVLTTRPGRFAALASQTRLLECLGAGKGRINLAWGSNTIIQVAAGYADVSLEFHKGFATHDLLPGLFIGLEAGLTILDLDGHHITARVDIEEIFARYATNPTDALRTRFVATKNGRLAAEVLELLASR